jgi:hypothetical protein
MEFEWALVGVDIKKIQHEAKMAEIHKRADAKRQGLMLGDAAVDPDTASLEFLGIEIEVEGE